MSSLYKKGIVITTPRRAFLNRRVIENCCIKDQIEHMFDSPRLPIQSRFVLITQPRMDGDKTPAKSRKVRMNVAKVPFMYSTVIFPHPRELSAVIST